MLEFNVQMLTLNAISFDRLQAVEGELSSGQNYSESSFEKLTFKE